MADTKKVLVTGSSSGIGKQISKTLKEKGYLVFQTGRRKLEVENYFQCNLSEIENALALYNYVKENFGCIDVLINNAGCYDYLPVESVKPDNLIKTFNLNFLSHYYLTSLVVPDMKKNNFGRIVNIASISGVLGEANASLYASTKSAYFGFSKSLGLELAKYNITVNSISPGWVDTELLEGTVSFEEKEEIKEVVPQRRFVEAVEIANLAAYLISPEAKGITGQNINLCAGLTCGC